MNLNRDIYRQTTTRQRNAHKPSSLYMATVMVIGVPVQVVLGILWAEQVFAARIIAAIGKGIDYCLSLPFAPPRLAVYVAFALAIALVSICLLAPVIILIAELTQNFLRSWRIYTSARKRARLTLVRPKNE